MNQPQHMTTVKTRLYLSQFLSDLTEIRIDVSLFSSSLFSSCSYNNISSNNGNSKSGDFWLKKQHICYLKCHIFLRKRTSNYFRTNNSSKYTFWSWFHSIRTIFEKTAFWLSEASLYWSYIEYELTPAYDDGQNQTVSHSFFIRSG